METFDAAHMAVLLKKAGAHSYADCPAVVHANARLLSVHLKDGGRRRISLPGRAARVTELISGKVVAENADSFGYDFESPDTRIFEIEIPGEVGVAVPRGLLYN